MADRTLKVEVVGDVDKLVRAYRKAEGATSNLDNRVGRLAKGGLKAVGIAAAAASTAIVGGFVYTLKRGFDELAESQKVSAQTAAAIKSTGGAAQVTQKHIESLAGSLSRLSGIDDEVIQSGQNVLLSFQSIRNEAGKGNDIFDQATLAVTNFAARTGKAVPAAATLIGKALEDPAHKLSGLARAGIVFTDAQKKMVTEMVKGGRTMDAQKFVLAELEKRYGGAAKAAGQTLPGQLARAKNAFDEVSAQIAVKFLPILTKALEWVNSHWPQISAVMEAVAGAIGAAVGKVVGFFKDHWTTISAIAEGVWAAMVAAWPIVKAALEAFSALVAYVAGGIQRNWPQISATTKEVFGTVKAVIQTTVAIVQALWDRFGSTIVAITKTTFQTIGGVIKGAMEVIRGIVNIIGGLLHGDFSRVWLGIKQVFGGAISAITALLRGAITIWATAAKALGKAILDGIVTALSGLANAVLGKIREVWGVIKGAVGTAYAFAFNIGRAIVDGIIGGLGNLISRVGGAIKSGLSSAVHFAGGFLHGSGPFQFTKQAIGEQMVQGVVEGVTPMAAKVGPALARGLTASVAAAKTAFMAKAKDLATAFGQMAENALAAFDAKMAAWVPPAQKLLDKMNLAQTTQGLQQAINDAKSTLEKAKLDQAWNAVMLPGETTDEWVARVRDANQRLLDAQAGYKSAMDAQRQQQLTTDAAHQQTAHDTEVAANRTKLEQILTDLGVNYAKQKITHNQAQTEIVKILKSFGVKYMAAGNKLGDSFVDGILQQVGEAYAAGKALAAAAEAGSKGAPAPRYQKGKPAAGLPHLAVGGIVKQATVALIGEKGPEAVVPLKQMGSMPGGGGLTINVTVHGPVVGSGGMTELAQRIRAEFQGISRSVPGALPA